MSVEVGYCFCTFLGIVVGIFMTYLAMTWEDDEP